MKMETKRKLLIIPVIIVGVAKFLMLRSREGHTIPQTAKMASRECFRAILPCVWDTLCPL